MALAKIQPWLVRAQHDHFAIGAFNANTLEQIQAIVQAADDESAPAIIQISHRALLHMGNGNPTQGLRYAAELGRLAAESVRVPVVLHLDHGTETEVPQALALGFTSVMFDGGDLPIEQNIALTIKLGAIAHSMGASMEAEVNAVPRSNGQPQTESVETLTRTEDAVEFARLTGVDSLAIAIGSVHAVKQKVVELDLDRLKRIRAAVNVPLVLHGSSGVKDEHISQAIAMGICKVNVATQLNIAFTSGVRMILAHDPDQVDPRKYLSQGRQEMIERIRERIQYLGASGKAKSA